MSNFILVYLLYLFRYIATWNPLMLMTMEKDKDKLHYWIDSTSKDVNMSRIVVKSRSIRALVQVYQLIKFPSLVHVCIKFYVKDNGM